MEHNGERVQGRLVEPIATTKRWTVEVAGKQVEMDEDALGDTATTEETDASSSQTTPATVSARAARSRRRQEVDTKKRKNVKSNSGGMKRQRTDEESECVKVKLLTGTLLIYRGQHARAEFVRRV